MKSRIVLVGALALWLLVGVRSGFGQGAWVPPPMEPLAQLPSSQLPSSQLPGPVQSYPPNIPPPVNDPDQPVGSGLTEQEIAAVEAQVLEEMEEEAAWYDWMVPAYLHMPVNWESSFELGIDGSEGNAKTLTFRSGADIRRKADWSDLTIALNYVKSSAERLETKHNAQLDANHDWLLGESPWSLFAKTILVYDEFRPFDLELTLNSGIAYQFIDNEVWKFKGRFGSGAVRQWDGPDDSWRPEAMLGIDFAYTISCRQKLYAKSDYFPDWSDYEIYRIRTDAGWELLLDEATNMSLKLGVIDRYDSNSGGTKPNSLDYSLLLLWKL